MKEVEEWQNTKASLSASLTESKDCFWALAVVVFCFVVQLMVGFKEATSKQASSTAAALASSTRLSTVISWLTFPFMLIIKNVSWTGPVATMYEQIGFHVVDTVSKAIWAIAAGKCGIEEEGARSVVLGLSCRSHDSLPG